MVTTIACMAMIGNAPQTYNKPQRRAYKIGGHNDSENSSDHDDSRHGLLGVGHVLPLAKWYKWHEVDNRDITNKAQSPA